MKVIDVGTANQPGEVVVDVENPAHQAPEQPKQEGSSGQTDLLPAEILDLQHQVGTKAATGVASPLKGLSRLYKKLALLKTKMVV